MTDILDDALDVAAGEINARIDEAERCAANNLNPKLRLKVPKRVLDELYEYLKNTGWAVGMESSLGLVSYRTSCPPWASMEKFGEALTDEAGRTKKCYLYLRAPVKEVKSDS